MDDSVDLFYQEQERLGAAGGPNRYFLQHIWSNLATVAIVTATMCGLLLFLGQFPRNPDNSVKLSLYGSVLAALAILSVLVLKYGKPKVQAIRWTCWIYFGFALISISAGVADALIQKGN